MTKSAKTYGSLLLIALFFLFPSCNHTADTHTTQTPVPTILVSLAPYRFFVEKIAQSLVTVEVLVPTGASPHAYEPTPKQMMKASSAVLWLCIGESFEKPAQKALELLDKKLTIVDLRQDIPLIRCVGCHSQEDADNHIWLSPQMAQIQVQTILQALIKQFPEHKDEFITNAAVFTQELQELDHSIQEDLARISIRTIAVSHPAFAYYCRDYDLKQLSIEQEGREPTPRQLTELINQLKVDRVRVIFVQEQYNSKGAQQIADILNLEICSSDPYNPDYIKNLVHFTSQVAQYSR